MRRPRLRTALILAGALGGSQLGHLLAFQMRYGGGRYGAAGGAPVAGLAGHAYLLPALSLVTGAAGTALVLALGLAAVVRLRSSHRWRYPSRLELLAITFSLQLAMFAGQELLEPLLLGTPTPALSGVIAWGVTGQLPAALVVTLVLRWLLAATDAAATGLAAPAAPIGFAPVLAAGAAQRPPVSGRGSPAPLLLVGRSPPPAR